MKINQKFISTSTKRFSISSPRDLMCVHTEHRSRILSLSSWDGRQHHGAMMSCVMMMQIWQFTGKELPEPVQQGTKHFSIRFMIIVPPRSSSLLDFFLSLSKAHSRGPQSNIKSKPSSHCYHAEFMCGPLFYALLNTNNHNIEL